MLNIYKMRSFSASLIGFMGCSDTILNIWNWSQVRQSATQLFRALLVAKINIFVPKLERKQPKYMIIQYTKKNDFFFHKKIRVLGTLVQHFEKNSQNPNQIDAPFLNAVLSKEQGGYFPYFRSFVDYISVIQARRYEIKVTKPNEYIPIEG